MKKRQREWADSAGLDARVFDNRWKESWVLRTEDRTRNCYRPEWWNYIRGREHRWSRALTSSQCFAVNLFAPLKEDSTLARAAWARLWSRRPLEAGDAIEVEFEWTPDGGPEWLGERHIRRRSTWCYGSPAAPRPSVSS